jgi:hypothetical protein
MHCRRSCVVFRPEQFLDKMSRKADRPTANGKLQSRDIVGGEEWEHSPGDVQLLGRVTLPRGTG